MKYRLFAIISMVSSLLVSCMKEAPAIEETEITIIASTADASSRTATLEGGTVVYWEPGDEVNVFFNGTGSRLVTNTTELTKVASFSGYFQGVINFSEGFSDDTPLLGLYPYCSDATADNETITTLLPSQQTGRADSFGQGMNISVARSNSLKMGFYNVCGGVRFSVTKEGVKRVSFEGNDGESLAGKIKIAFDGNIPVIGEVLEEKQKITLTLPDDNAFEVGKWYYMMMLPGTLENGFKMTFVTETQSAELTSSSAVTIKRSKFGSLENIDEGLQYTDRSEEIKTIVCDPNSQPIYAGGLISNYQEDLFVKKGVIVSRNRNDLIVSDQSEMVVSELINSNFGSRPIADFGIMDCTGINEEEYLCPLCLLSGDTDYYVRAFAIFEEGLIIYGDVIKIHSQVFTRYSGTRDYASVYYPFTYSTFDLVTDEIIDPDQGFYYSTNETRNTVRFKTGASGGFGYKFATEWNYKLWYHHHGGELQKRIAIPVMKMVNGKLEISKAQSDQDRSIEIFYSINGNGARPEFFTEKYESPISVSPGETVYCYAVTSEGYLSLTNRYKVDGGEDVPPEEPETHTFVDLGLPSGTLWATCNIGANTPEEYGDYFAWGETEPKEDYSWSTYKWCMNGDVSQLTKYCTNSSYGYNGFTDNKTVLDPEDDAAAANWGEGWRMPTYDELDELKTQCTWEWTILNGVNGRKVTSNKEGYTDKWIFLPAAGYQYGMILDNAGSYGDYSSSFLYAGGPGSAYRVYFSSDRVYWSSDYYGRFYGHSVRPVYGGSVHVTGLSISPENAAINFGETLQLTATITPSNATNKRLTWSSSDESVAKVSADGLVSAVGKGSARITVKTVDGGYSAICAVSVNYSTPEMVDLGLSVKWASFNLGANSPEDYGAYFAWGETAPKEDYSWSTYKWCNGSSNTMTKYCTNSSYGYNGFSDNKTELDPEDDAATVNLGGDWRMPTYDELDELKTQCTWEWTTLNGIYGRKVTSKKEGYTGKWIFLPAAGCWIGASFYNASSYGSYYSSSLNTDDPYNVYLVVFNTGSVYWGHDPSRERGQSVRPVRTLQSENKATALNLSFTNTSGTIGGFLYIGYPYKFSVTATPSDAVTQYEWKVEDTRVATISGNGDSATLSTKDFGKTAVVVTDRKSGLSARYEFGTAVTDFQFTENTGETEYGMPKVTLVLGEKHQISYSCTPSYATKVFNNLRAFNFRELINNTYYVVSESTIVDVDENGLMTAKGVGTTLIKANNSNGVYKTGSGVDEIFVRVLSEYTEQEPNNDFPYANKIKLDVPVSFYISTTTDVDCFQYSANKTSISFDLTYDSGGSGADKHIRWELYDSSCNLRGSGTSSLIASGDFISMTNQYVGTNDGYFKFYFPTNWYSYPETRPTQKLRLKVY